MTYNVFGGTLSLTQSINQSFRKRLPYFLLLKLRFQAHHHNSYASNLQNFRYITALTVADSSFSHRISVGYFNHR